MRKFMNKKLIVLTLILLAFFTAQNVFASEIQLQSLSGSNLNINKKVPKLYKPSYVAIGEEAQFKIIAPKGSTVYLAFSYSNTGVGYKGLDLNLGSDAEVIKAVMPEKGIYNFKLKIKNEENMIDRYIYIEGFVTYPNDPNTYHKAQLIDINGKETKLNRIKLIKRTTGEGFMLSPSSTLNTIMMNQYDDDSNYDPINDMQYTTGTPEYIKNMRAPRHDD